MEIKLPRSSVWKLSSPPYPKFLPLPPSNFEKYFFVFLLKMSFFIFSLKNQQNFLLPELENILPLFYILENWRNWFDFILFKDIIFSLIKVTFFNKKKSIMVPVQLPTKNVKSFFFPFCTMQKWDLSSNERKANVKKRDIYVILKS